MILILASRDDPTAPRLAATWRKAGMDTDVLTCDDLTAGGWSWVPGQIERARLSLRGRTVFAKHLRGVLVRLPCVTARELPAIDPEDREYVAAELTAFLAAFLLELPCRVANRPTPTRLDGPSWSPERWRREAQRVAASTSAPPLGRSTVFRSPQPSSDDEEKPGDTVVTWIDGRCFGAAHLAAREATAELTRAAGVDLVNLHFRTDGGVTLVDADLCPPLDTPEKHAAARRLFEPRPAPRK